MHEEDADVDTAFVFAEDRCCIKKSTKFEFGNLFTDLFRISCYT